jgi:hypothetical protein
MNIAINTPMSTATNPAQLAPPVEDINSLWNLGIAGVPFAQYLRWADDLNIFVALADKDSVTLDDVEAFTPLSQRGADALMGVLCGMKILLRQNNTFRLTDLGREYLDRRSMYYVGPAFYGMLGKELPPRFRKGEKERSFAKMTNSVWHKVLYLFSRKQMGRPERLAVQHSRNFASAVAAVHSGMFKGVRHLVDVGGGSGVFAIPIALAQTETAVTLVELPRALPHIADFLKQFDVADRIKLMGFNVHESPWPIDEPDGILLGNFLHFCSDEESITILKEAHRTLAPNGKLFVHEMLWNDNKDGPLATAMWNFWMISVSAGRQRTAGELLDLLKRAGFQRMEVSETSGSFSMLICPKDA